MASCGKVEDKQGRGRLMGLDLAGFNKFLEILQNFLIHGLSSDANCISRLYGVMAEGKDFFLCSCKLENDLAKFKICHKKMVARVKTSGWFLGVPNRTVGRNIVGNYSEWGVLSKKFADKITQEFGFKSKETKFFKHFLINLIKLIYLGCKYDDFLVDKLALVLHFVQIPASGLPMGAFTVVEKKVQNVK